MKILADLFGSVEFNPYICPRFQFRKNGYYLYSLVKNRYFTGKTVILLTLTGKTVMKISYLSFMLGTLGYRFENTLTLAGIGKNILHDLYEDSPNDIKMLTSGTHPNYRKTKKEDWSLIVYNNVEVPVCTRKFSTEHNVVRLVDRSVDELKTEARRIYEVLKENGKL